MRFEKEETEAAVIGRLTDNNDKNNTEWGGHPLYRPSCSGRIDEDIAESSKVEV